MIRQTSIEAYKKAISSGLLSKKREQIYTWLFTNGPATTNEIFKALIGNSTINQPNIHARLSELRQMDCVYEKDTVVCPITNVKVIQWDITDKYPKPLPKREKSIRLTETDIRNAINKPNVDDVDSLIKELGFTSKVSKKNEA